MTLAWGGVDSFEAEQTVDREDYATEILGTGEAFVEFIETEVTPYCEQHPDKLYVFDIRRELSRLKEPVAELAEHLGREPAWRDDS